MNPYLLGYELLVALTTAASYALAVGYVQATPPRLFLVAFLAISLSIARRLRDVITRWWRELHWSEAYWILLMSPWLIGFGGMVLVTYLFDIQWS